jgi:hypothetical protein
LYPRLTSFASIRDGFLYETASYMRGPQSSPQGQAYPPLSEPVLDANGLTLLQDGSYKILTFLAQRDNFSDAADPVESEALEPKDLLIVVLQQRSR